MSIAVAMLDLVQRHIEATDHVERVRMKAGPLRGIDPDTMSMAWRAATTDTNMEGSVLEMDSPQWQLHCPRCDRRWQSVTLITDCACGYDQSVLEGGDELLLLSIDVAD